MAGSLNAPLTLRSDIMIGGRCARPYYLQGYTQPISNRRDMLTSRILLAVDNLIVPSDIDFIKGSCTNIQVGAQNIIMIGCTTRNIC